MARRKSDLEIEVDEATANWIAINKKIDPVEWAAWIKWRREQLHAKVEPEDITVPTPFPPLTVGAAKEYIETVRKIRKLIGWTDSKSKLTSDPAAFLTVIDGGKPEAAE